MVWFFSSKYEFARKEQFYHCHFCLKSNGLESEEEAINFVSLCIKKKKKSKEGNKTLLNILIVHSFHRFIWNRSPLKTSLAYMLDCCVFGAVLVFMYAFNFACVSFTTNMKCPLKIRRGSRASSIMFPLLFTSDKFVNIWWVFRPYLRIFLSSTGHTITHWIE